MNEHVQIYACASFSYVQSQLEGQKKERTKLRENEFCGITLNFFSPNYLENVSFKLFQRHGVNFL
jgi:hypothetical protein